MRAQKVEAPDFHPQLVRMREPPREPPWRTHQLVARCEEYTIVRKACDGVWCVPRTRALNGATGSIVLDVAGKHRSVCTR